jgi:PAS domain S-box-containing protein
MTPSEWPLRLVPRRSPPVWQALPISAAAILGAVAMRWVFLGFDNTAGLSATYFPAFIMATLYAGPRWGWVTLLVALVIGAYGGFALPTNVSHHSLIVLYALSGAVTVLVAAGLRETLLRLDEAQVAEAKVQADLVATEARFRLLADSAPVLMWVSRPDGGREFANRAYLDFMGIGYEEAQEFDWRTVLHPDDLPHILEQDAAGGPDTTFVWEARYKRSDGEYRWVRSTSQPRFLTSGERSGYIGIGYDITDAKQAQADLKRINDLLAERVQAALSERDEAEAALRHAQKLEAVGQLTGGVAHDFNNLLTVIVGALDMIQRHPADAARRDRMIEAAQAAARRGERLTQQLLAFSRRQALKPELVCVDDLLAESVPLLNRAVGEAVTLSVSPTAPGAVANIDPSQFEAAVMNLVVNARDATPAGGSIRVESFRCTVAASQVEEVPPGDYLCVAVHDTGVGMDPDVAARVFEPFFTTKEPGRGTGLGLSQVYGFARQSGGGAMVESAPGKGATVRIYLPLAAREAEARPAAPVHTTPSAANGQAGRVLLVEDDLGVGDMVESMLSDPGRPGNPASPRAHRPDAHRSDHARRQERRGAGPRGGGPAPRPAGDPDLRLHRREPRCGGPGALATAEEALRRRGPGGGDRRRPPTDS